MDNDRRKYRIWSERDKRFITDTGHGILYKDGSWQCYCEFDDSTGGFRSYDTKGTVLENPELMNPPVEDSKDSKKPF